ncbi:hypothetical protein [Acaricomes phytoseiuli]|uniref:hypothetical protein n=1 Tax=Acaricomes phytoseiuli TaxID=291968 RepID=UPI000360E0F2|nr:hypothetical protein [Acaricomes phytoseiuli]
MVSGLAMTMFLGALVTAVPAAQGARLQDTLLPNVEEARLSTPLPGAAEPYSQQIIRQSGLQPVVDAFAAQLPTAAPQTIEQRLEAAGRGLWQSALDNAQGRNPQYDGDRYEDHGLYWARLSMRMTIKSWVAQNPLALPRLNELLDQFERSSRGLSELGFTADPGVAKVMISGFDPFLLDSRLSMANPSGAAILQLSGRVLDTPQGPIQVQAVMLPVTWSGFDAGIVEDAYGPQLQQGPANAQIAMTISQGGNRFDIERWAGVWRGGSVDNLNEGVAQGYRQEVPPAAGWPQTRQSPQFINTTLPAAQMQAVPTGPYPVNFRQSYCSSSTPERLDVNCAEGVPAEDAFARAGSGGDYLSNESMYRVNRLREGLGRDDIAGGHLHVPVLSYTGTQSTGSSEQFRASRQNVAEQTRELILLAPAAVR